MLRFVACPDYDSYKLILVENDENVLQSGHSLILLFLESIVDLTIPQLGRTCLST